MGRVDLTIQPGAGRSGLHKQLLLASIAASALLAGSAFAQTVTAPPPPVTAGGLKDVVVTATRQSTKLQKTPVAVTVFGAKQLAQQNILTTRILPEKFPV